MTRPLKSLTILLWVASIASIIAFVLVRSLSHHINDSAAIAVKNDQGQVVAFMPAPNAGEPLPILYDAPQFVLTSQDGKPFSSKSLLGHPWIADFIFTRCASLCPIMSARMEALQHDLPWQIKLVSFSVDPKNDTPAAMRDYGRNYDADFSRWTFLTGNEKTQAHVISQMKIGVVPATATSALQHSPQFVLVDAQGKVRGYYDSNDTQQLDQLQHDAKTLAAETGSVAAAP